MSLPDDVEEAMADIAFVFLWPPDVMERMDVIDLARWHEKASVRLEALQGRQRSRG